MVSDLFNSDNNDNSNLQNSINNKKNDNNGLDFSDSIIENDSVFVDLIEIDKPEQIQINQTKKTSPVDEIVYTETDHDLPQIISKIEITNNNSTLKNSKKKEHPSLHRRIQRLNLENEKKSTLNDEPIIHPLDQGIKKKTEDSPEIILDEIPVQNIPEQNPLDNELEIIEDFPEIKSPDQLIKNEETNHDEAHVELSAENPQKKSLGHKLSPGKTDKQNTEDPSGEDQPPDDLEEIPEAESIDEAEAIEDSSDAETEYLIKNIKPENGSISYPGRIKLSAIDSFLSTEKKSEKPEKKDAGSDEIFGVNRAKVFYNIDKQIYSSRSASRYSKSKIRKVKKGLFLPVTVAAIMMFLLLISVILLPIYFISTSSSTLEDNVIKDDSILAKIAQQQKEEARLAGEKLEEERRMLEDEKKRMESTLNEELMKKQAEIEKAYQQKMEQLSAQGISEQELDRYRTQFDQEKNFLLEQARSERDQKIDEQNQLLADKDRKLTEAMDNLQKAVEKNQADVDRIRQEFEARSQADAQEKALANQKLTEIRENEEKIADFNATVYQFITAAMGDFQKKKYDDSMKKLTAVLSYYNSRIDFVKSNESLKNKMETDIFFVESIRGLIDESKGSLEYNKEYGKIINKFKTLTETYKKAEQYYAMKIYDRSGKEYEKVLQEFDEINAAYLKVKEIEKQIQDQSALKYYNTAQLSLKNNNYDLALTQLATLIKENPLSDYKNQALADIVKISENISTANKAAGNNAAAKELFAKADTLKNTNKYDEAMKAYQQVITAYPLSDYTQKALDETGNLARLLYQKGYADYNTELKKKFDNDYQKYLEYNKNGDYENARKYYLQALKSAFNTYTNNTINDFSAVDEKYIALRLKNVKQETASNNTAAKELFSQADNLQNSKKYDEALKLYEQVITDYPLSDYTGKALNEINNIAKLVNQKGYTEYDAELKKKFDGDYQKYLAYNKKGDYENARKYYLQALHNAFNIYTNNTIGDFSTLDEKYIALRLKNTKQETASNNTAAKDLFTKADNLQSSKKYDEALKLYQQVITDYPLTDYTGLALNQIMTISKLMNQNNNPDYDTELKKKFDGDYQKYLAYNKKGDYENARKYYLQALQNAFNIYTNNSIGDFSALDDKYIETKLNSNVAVNKNISPDVNKNISPEVAEKYAQEIDKQKKLIENLEKEKTELKNQYDALVKTSNTSNIKSKQDFDKEITKKNNEIQKLKKYIDDVNLKLANNENDQLIKDYEKKLNIEKEKSETLQKQLFESYKKDAQLSQEKEKIAALEKSLKEIQTQYNDLNARYEQKTITKDEKQKIEAEVKKLLEEKYQLEKEKALEIEREKVRQEFEAELEKMKNFMATLTQADTSKLDSLNQKNTSSFKGQLIGRVNNINKEIVTFQFISLDFSTKNILNYGDKIQIIRYNVVNENRSEVLIGYMTVTSIENGSLSGFGKITELVRGNTVKVGDLLKN